MSLSFEEFNEENPLLNEEDNEEEPVIIGGISARFQKESIDEPVKRFENLIVPIGLYNVRIENTNERDGESEDHSLIDEKRFSKLFYSVAKDLGSSRTKAKTSVTKKNRQ